MSYKPEYLDKRGHHGIVFKGDHYEQFVGTRDFGYTIYYDLQMNELDRIGFDDPCFKEEAEG